MKPRPINQKRFYAYFSPDGYIQFISIAPNEFQCRDLILKLTETTPSKLEKSGYVIKSIILDIQILDTTS